MVLCPNGSSANPSSPPYVWITWVESREWLGTRWAIFGWIATALAPVLVKLETFCAIEPPQPVYPGDDTVAAASHDPAAFETVLQFLKDSATWWVWSHNCVCNASDTPGCVTYLYDHSTDLTQNASSTNLHIGVRFTPLIGGLTLWGVWIDANAGDTFDIFWIDIPTTISSFRTVTALSGWNPYYFTSPLSLIPGHQYETGWRTPDGTSSVSYKWQAYTPPNYGSELSIVNWYYGGWLFDVETPNPDTKNIDPIVCVGSPASYPPESPPGPTTVIPPSSTTSCTTIDDLCALLQNKIQSETLILQRIDLIQRRLLPFAWIAGTPITGLTGHGVITVADILGFIVILTNVPIGWGATFEVPRRLIPSVGSLEASDGTNVTDNKQLHYDHEIWLWNASWATEVAYSFRPGIVVTLIPLKPEP